MKLIILAIVVILTFRWLDKPRRRRAEEARAKLWQADRDREAKARQERRDRARRTLRDLEHYYENKFGQSHYKN